jgi:hypothetical protein
MSFWMMMMIGKGYQDEPFEYNFATGKRQRSQVCIYNKLIRIEH